MFGSAAGNTAESNGCCIGVHSARYDPSAVSSINGPISGIADMNDNAYCQQMVKPSEEIPGWVCMSVRRSVSDPT